MEIGNRISEVREKLDLSQDEVAKKINLTRSTISLIERGQRNASDRVVRDICREFNVNEDWLRTGEGNWKNEFPDSEEKFLNSLMKKVSGGTIYEKEILKTLVDVMENAPEGYVEYMYKTYKDMVNRIEQKKGND